MYLHSYTPVSFGASMNPFTHLDACAMRLLSFVSLFNLFLYHNCIKLEGAYLLLTGLEQSLLTDRVDGPREYLRFMAFYDMKL